MAELHVQRKRNNYWQVWLLIVIIVIATAIYWYINYYQKNAKVIPGVATPTRVDSTKP